MFDEYVVSGVHTSVAWVIQDTPTKFRGHTLTLRPGTDELLPSVVLKVEPPMTLLEGQRLVKAFLTSLSWAKGFWIVDETTSSGGCAVRLGRYKGSRVYGWSEPTYLPDPTDPEARRGLALMREARGLNNLAYECLGYFRVINLSHKGDTMIDWINAAHPRIREVQAVERLEALLPILVSRSDNLGRYLYGQRRCAIAHASLSDDIDPDDPLVTRDLSQDRCLIEALAALSIEEDLGVLSPQSMWEVRQGQRS